MTGRGGILDVRERTPDSTRKRVSTEGTDGISFSVGVETIGCTDELRRGFV